jgi:hypothetical protein
MYLNFKIDPFLDFFYIKKNNQDIVILINYDSSKKLIKISKLNIRNLKIFSLFKKNITDKNIFYIYLSNYNFYLHSNNIITSHPLEKNIKYKDNYLSQIHNKLFLEKKLIYKSATSKNNFIKMFSNRKNFYNSWYQSTFEKIYKNKNNLFITKISNTSRIKSNNKFINIYFNKYYLMLFGRHKYPFIPFAMKIIFPIIISFSYLINEQQSSIVLRSIIFFYILSTITKTFYIKNKMGEFSLTSELKLISTFITIECLIFTMVGIFCSSSIHLIFLDLLLIYGLICKYFKLSENNKNYLLDLRFFSRNYILLLFLVKLILINFLFTNTISEILISIFVYLLFLISYEKTFKIFYRIDPID